MASPSASLLPTRWPEILDNVQNTLEQAATEAARSAELLEAALGPPLSPADALLGSATLDASFQQLANCVDQADRTAAATESALQQSEEALRRWLALAEALRQKLANGAAVSV